MRATNVMHPGCPQPLSVATAHSAATLKVRLLLLDHEIILPNHELCHYTDDATHH
jgi:hypothetical protein